MTNTGLTEAYKIYINDNNNSMHVSEVLIRFAQQLLQTICQLNLLQLIISTPKHYQITFSLQ